MESGTPTTFSVASYVNGANGTITFTALGAGELKIGQRLTLTATAATRITEAPNDPLVNDTVVINKVDEGAKTVTVDILALTVNASGSLPYKYDAIPGVGEWGTMIDTGQFNLKGVLAHVDVGISAGGRWYIVSDPRDFARHPTDRSGFSSSESAPTHLVDAGGSFASARWGTNNAQRIERLLLWAPSGSQSELTEVEVNYRTDGGN